MIKVPSMTKAHFELIARTIYDWKTYYQFDDIPFNDLIDMMADSLKLTNPSFNESKFREKCGYDGS